MVHAGASSDAGQQFPFDHLAANVLARAKIPLAIVQGRDLVNLERAIEGRTFDGSHVE
jgi:uridylate kinase